MLHVRALSTATKVMRAIQILKHGGTEVLQVREIPVPSPGEKEVLIRVHSAGINPIDTYIREGHHALTPPLPIVLGGDVAGVVDKLGTNVSSFKVGDRVFAGLNLVGGYAEYAVCNVRTVFPLSEKLNYSQGAGLYIPYFTAYRGLITKCQAKPGENLLIHGASGAVGIATLQIAKHLGLTVVGTAGSQDGLDLLKKLGTDHVFNHKEKGYLNNAVAAIGGKGFDVIIENLANVNLGADFTVLNQNGRVGVIGSRGTVEVNPRSLMMTEGCVHGIMLKHATEAEENEMRDYMLKGVEDGWVNPVVAHEYTLDEAPQAHHDIIHNTGSRGKLVFKII